MKKSVRKKKLTSALSYIIIFAFFLQMVPLLMLAKFQLNSTEPEICQLSADCTCPANACHCDHSNDIPVVETSCHMDNMDAMSDNGCMAHNTPESCGEQALTSRCTCQGFVGVLFAGKNILLYINNLKSTSSLNMPIIKIDSINDWLITAIVPRDIFHPPKNI